MTHFSAGDKTQDKMKRKPFIWCDFFFFFHKAHLILLLCVYKVLNLFAPQPRWCWDAMATEAACDWQVTLAAQTWSASETVTQAHWCQTCLSIQDTAYAGLTLCTGDHPAFWMTEPANQGSVFCHLLSQRSVIDTLKVFLGAKSLMCCTVKKQSGMSWPTPAQGCYRCCLPSLMHYSFFIFSLI